MAPHRWHRMYSPHVRTACTQEEDPGDLTASEVARLLAAMLPDAPSMTEADALDFICDYEGEGASAPEIEIRPCLQNAARRRVCCCNLICFASRLRCHCHCCVASGSIAVAGRLVNYLKRA